MGAAVGSAVVDLCGRMPGFTSLKSLLAADALAEAQDIVNGADADCALSEIRWLPPVPDAEKIVCIGVNYGNRNAEYRDATPAPAYPSVFMRSRESLTGHLEPLVRPRNPGNSTTKARLPWSSAGRDGASPNRERASTLPG